MVVSRDNKTSNKGVTLLEVLAASVIIFIILSITLTVYFLSTVQATREIIDTQVKGVSRSLQSAVRAGLLANLAPNRLSFFFDFEGVRIFVPLPQPGQPTFVDLPDFNEDIDGDGVMDVDWDQDGWLDAPAFAMAQDPSTVGVAIDTDGDGVFGNSVPGDGPGDPAGMGEPWICGGCPGGISPAYDGVDNDGDGVIDDKALFLFPIGLKLQAEEGYYREPAAGAGTWVWQGTEVLLTVVVPPTNEDFNNDGIVPTTGAPGTVDAALTHNPIPGTVHFLPDVFEDLTGDGRISIGNLNPTVDQIPDTLDLDGDGIPDLDINNDTAQDEFEFTEDFNLNGFLDVPSVAELPGGVYYMPQHNDPVNGGFNLQDPLTFGHSPSASDPGPDRAPNYNYALLRQPLRNLGYNLRVERVEAEAGRSQGFGKINSGVYRITIRVYYDYAATLEEFRLGLDPEPVRVDSFEVSVR